MLLSVQELAQLAATGSIPWIDQTPTPLVSATTLTKIMYKGYKHSDWRTLRAHCSQAKTGASNSEHPVPDILRDRKSVV